MTRLRIGLVLLTLTLTATVMLAARRTEAPQLPIAGLNGTGIGYCVTVEAAILNCDDGVDELFRHLG